MGRLPQTTGSEQEPGPLHEVEILRARVTELEAQLAETERWGNQTVAAAQERLYWLDRWGVDLDSVMQRRSADRLRECFRAVRAVYRAGLKIKRSLSADR